MAECCTPGVVFTGGMVGTVTVVRHWLVPFYHDEFDSVVCVCVCVCVRAHACTINAVFFLWLQVGAPVFHSVMEGMIFQCFDCE